MPVVSVIMAYHQITPFFRPAVRSVLDQTLRDFELILVDNGTGEGLAPLAEDAHDNRLRLVRHASNRGIAASINAAAAVARGEFIALLDYDDRMLPARLERQVTCLRANSDAGLVACRAESIDASGRVTGREFSLSDSRDQFRYTQYAAPVVTPAYTGRREVFARLPYRVDFNVVADYDFLACAAELYPFTAVPEVLLQYRHHAGQTTRSTAAQVRRERATVQLLTARRRDGRDEGPGWTEMLRPQPGDEIDPAGMLREFARRSFAEGFPVLAAYHARRSIAEDPTPGSMLAGLRLFLHVWRRARLDTRLAAAMFFRGPVKALGVRPD
ncbi:MAG TPA: glycosyltransferase [Candidatus Didemnitutus sp.]|jgi:glycosyltransferase involved in cell wall biosynthesis